MADKQRNSENARVREKITEALFQLTREMPLSSISVTDLCQRAGVSRMAYYRNFSCKEEIFSNRLAEAVACYPVMAAPFIARGDSYSSVDCLEACYQLFYDNRLLVEALYRCGMTQSLFNAIVSMIFETWGKDSGEDMEFVCWMQCGAICGAYFPWARDDFKETPRQMAEKLNRFLSATS